MSSSQTQTISIFRLTSIFFFYSSLSSSLCLSNSNVNSFILMCFSFFCLHISKWLMLLLIPQLKFFAVFFFFLSVMMIKTFDFDQKNKSMNTNNIFVHLNDDQRKQTYDISMTVFGRPLSVDFVQISIDLFIFRSNSFSSRSCSNDVHEIFVPKQSNPSS